MLLYNYHKGISYHKSSSNISRVLEQENMLRTLLGGTFMGLNNQIEKLGNFS